MWLTEQFQRKREKNGMQTGVVTIGGVRAAICTDAERRGIAVCAPGGYVWRPRVGENVLVLKTEDGAMYTAAALPEEAENIEAGDVLLRTEGAQLRLCCDGTIRISGNVCVEGALLVNGTEVG